MENSELQELLLVTLPQWHYWVAKPMKLMLDERISVSMYYCMQMLRAHEKTMTMSEMARSVHCSKQQMTKTVNKLIECRFMERVPDPADRRIIRLGLTQEGKDFLARFYAMSAECFQPMFDRMSPEEQAEFSDALSTMHRIFSGLFEKQRNETDGG